MPNVEISHYCRSIAHAFGLTVKGGPRVRLMVMVVLAWRPMAPLVGPSVAEEDAKATRGNGYSVENL